MRYALVNGIKSKPSPKIHGICPHCMAETVSKCGKHITWHWAHKGKEICDPWWEGETQWHRNWKDTFPVEWQEISNIDPRNGEKHIADVQTPFGLTIEFQHSPISFEERTSRERFYNKMIWVVDGTKGLAPGYFTLGLHGPIQDDPLVYQIAWLGRNRILHNWKQSTTKVYLDFDDNCLWRLIFFDPAKKIGTVTPVPISIFLNDCITGREISVLKIPEGADRETYKRPKLEEIPRSR